MVKLENAKYRLGIEPYIKLLEDLCNIDYITEEEAEAEWGMRERTEEEKEEVKKYFSLIIGKENLNHLLNAIKENRQYPQIDYCLANINTGLNKKVQNYVVRPDKTIEIAGDGHNVWLAK